MSHTVNVQVITEDDETPGVDDLAKWARHALRGAACAVEMTVRVVGADEGRCLNEQWRQGSGPTNVLAFPIRDLEVAPELLGDVVICAPTANDEAERDGKLPRAHWAHLVIHGTLHLLGHDHLEHENAVKMEALERTLLRELGYPDPYL